MGMMKKEEEEEEVVVAARYSQTARHRRIRRADRVPDQPLQQDRDTQAHVLVPFLALDLIHVHVLVHVQPPAVGPVPAAIRSRPVKSAAAEDAAAAPPVRGRPVRQAPSHREATKVRSARTCRERTELNPTMKKDPVQKVRRRCRQAMRKAAELGFDAFVRLFGVCCSLLVISAAIDDCETGVV